jgi:four helix bundle protein
MRKNELLEKSFSFSVRVVKLSRVLAERNEYVLSNQILKSGTSIGANITEAQQAESTKDFIHKLCIANKEAFETEYWIKLLKEAGDITKSQSDSLIGDCNSLQKLLISVIKKLKSKNG